jgi:hypothetical protein
VAKIKTVTLVAATVTNVDLAGKGQVVEVLNVDGAEAVYFTVGNTDVTAPTVKGDDCEVLPKGVSTLSVYADPAGAAVDDAVRVKLISPGTPTVSVKLF